MGHKTPSASQCGAKGAQHHHESPCHAIGPEAIELLCVLPGHRSHGQQGSIVYLNYSSTTQTLTERPRSPGHSVRCGS